MRLRNRKGWRTGRTQPGMTEELAAQIERHGRQKRPKGNKHEIPGREARIREWNGSGERFHQQVQGQANSHTNHFGNKAMKDGGMIRHSFPGINSPGQAPVEHAPGHALGFSGASVEHAPGLSGVGRAVGGCGALEPGRRLTLSENPGKVLGESRARRKILGVICREFWENLGF